MDRLWRYHDSIKEQFHGAKNRGDTAQAEVILCLLLFVTFSPISTSRPPYQGMQKEIKRIEAEIRILDVQ
jgi:hypothetical protein